MRSRWNTDCLWTNKVLCALPLSASSSAYSLRSSRHLVIYIPPSIRNLDDTKYADLIGQTTFIAQLVVIIVCPVCRYLCFQLMPLQFRTMVVLPPLLLFCPSISGRTRMRLDIQCVHIVLHEWKGYVGDKNEQEDKKISGGAPSLHLPVVFARSLLGLFSRLLLTTRR